MQADDMHLETIRAEIRGQTATVVLDRPDVLNCQNQQSVDELHAVLDYLATCDEARIVVFRGAGRAFCTGIDLTALSEGRIEDRFFRDWEIALRRIETLEGVTIAVLHSHCIGGGLQLALACDFRIARDDSRLGITAVKEGIIPGLGVWRLARYVGLGRAKRLALLAEVVNAAEAQYWGLVDVVVDQESLDSRVDDLVARALRMPKTSTRLTKRLIDAAPTAPFEDCLERFCQYQRHSVQSSEHVEAMRVRQQERAARGSAGS